MFAGFKTTGTASALPVRQGQTRRVIMAACLAAIMLASVFPATAAEDKTIKMSPGISITEHDPNVFGPDPTYEDSAYDAQKQLDIYGDKHLNPTQRPLLEWGRELYQYGTFQPAPTWFGETNPMQPQFLMYGDWRTAIAYNDNGDSHQSRIATRLNLEMDLRITATERFHAFFRPLDKNGKFTRLDFGGEDHGFELELDGNVDGLFFEGDLGAIVGGATGESAPFDLPVAVGLMPLLFQNGIWVEDAFTGFAFTIPSLNNRHLDISNMDITFFFGFDQVTSPALPDDSEANVYGATTFIEAMKGYWEIGYAYVHDTHDDPDSNALVIGRSDLLRLGDQSYHNFAVAYTRRYGGLVSNSVRLVANFGQDPSFGNAALGTTRNVPQTADGFIVLVENSLITDKPSTVVPYFNVFAGFDRPQSLARANGAGGILKNTGILFETDGLTGFPKMDDAAGNTVGGALGIEFLFGLDRQLVLEAATVQTHDDISSAPGDQYGLGFRYQHPINNAMILRLDGIYAWRNGGVDDLTGLRFEFRYKF